MFNIRMKKRGAPMPDTELTRDIDENFEPEREQLRVAVVTGSLGSAGAEKQAFYMVRALADAGVAVRVYNLGRGGQYEEALRRLPVEVTWFGRLPHPLLRLPLLIAAMLSFRPHVIQSIHAYTNLYSAIAGRVLRAASVGGLRGDLSACLEDHPRLAKYLLSWPDGIVVNSRRALHQAKHSGLLVPDRVHFLPNGIDLSCFPPRIPGADARGDECNCVCIGRLIPSKRVDMFLRALAAARSVEPRLRGAIVGHGSDETRLQRLATELRLFPGAVSFLGFQEGVIDILQQSSIFVFCSESEGTPNVIIEAMAASLPVITTPAGDAPELVQQAHAGYVVPFNNAPAMADAMVRLARSRSLRLKFGAAGRDYIERRHAASDLGARLLTIYAEVARVSFPQLRSDFILRLRDAQRTPVSF